MGMQILFKFPMVQNKDNFSNNQELLEFAIISSVPMTLLYDSRVTF